MSDNKNRSSKSRQISSSKAPPQIVNFFSKPLSPNNDRTPSETVTSPSTDRKRKLSERESSSSSYAAAIQKDAIKITKVRKAKKVDNLVSAFFQRENSDDVSDFESPRKQIQFKTPPVLPKAKVNRKRKLPAKQTKSVLETEIFEKVLRHHADADGVSSDDLQMALALSRSLTDTQSTNGESSNFSISETIRNAEPSQKADIVRQTFEKFGFKRSDNNDYDYRDFFVNLGSKKKWQTKFTPLTRRSDHLQKLKLKTKVKNILRLSEINQSADNQSTSSEYGITSSYLQQFFVPKSPSYIISLATTETTLQEFYVNDLVPISTLPCGCLLKNWSEIPGRDVSPQRNVSGSCNVNGSSIVDNESSSFQQSLEWSSSQIGTSDVVKEIEFPQHRKTSQTLQPGDDCPMTDLTNSSLGRNALTGNDQTRERQMSPDMFSDYESSANNSLNDDVFPSDRSNDIRDNNTSRESSTSQADKNHERVSSLEQPTVTDQQIEKDSIVLSSDDSNEGGSTINVTTPPKSSDFSYAKRLSFTERLELYNSDPALGLTDDDHIIPMNIDHLSQDSIAISDDEINYSLNRDITKPHTISQESIVLSDDEPNRMHSQSSDDTDEERQSFASIELDNNDSFNFNDRMNLTVQELCQAKILSGSTKASQESILLSDSEEEKEMEDDIEDPQSFVSTEMENGLSSQKSTDLNIDNEIFESSQSFNDDDLINLSVREMCQREFVSASVEASSPMPFSRTTSDLTFERKVRKSSRTPAEFNNYSDEELDEFDKLVRGKTFQTPIPHAKSIEISDDEDAEPVQRDSTSVIAGSTQSAECNEFIVQSMDQVYEVRTGVLVSPKPDYENMNSPERSVHLKKFGLKALSKRKAVICLEHIYNRLHPFIELDERDDFNNIFDPKGVHATGSDTMRTEISNPTASNFDVQQENENDIFLPSAPRAKKPWCLQPLHIAWHNLIHSNAKLFDDVLQYKPIDLVEIRSLLKSVDLRYEMNDLISFLDRKCITFKTDTKRNNAMVKK